MRPGRYIPAGWEETGKNGAMPDPKFDALVGVSECLCSYQNGNSP